VSTWTSRARGASAATDEAVAKLPAVMAFLRQPPEEAARLPESAIALAG